MQAVLPLRDVRPGEGLLRPGTGLLRKGVLRQAGLLRKGLRLLRQARLLRKGLWLLR
jgi:hypothetical protein